MEYTFRVIETKRVISIITIVADSRASAEEQAEGWTSSMWNGKNLTLIDEVRDYDIDLEEI